MWGEGWTNFRELLDRSVRPIIVEEVNTIGRSETVATRHVGRFVTSRENITMNRRTLCWGLFCLFLFGSWGDAQFDEPFDNQIEFLQKLRQKGSHSLTFEYLDLLAKSPDPKMAAIVPVERARSLVAMARDKDAEQRFALFEQARGEFQKFATANQGKPEGALGLLELARLTTYHGQALLTRALREEDNEEAHKIARPAEDKFKQAAKDLGVAIKSLETVAGDANLSDEKKKLVNKELLQARFDIGINIIDQARTYIDTGKDKVNTARALLIDEARKVFEELAKDEEGAVGSLANAWLMKVAMEQQAPDAVQKYLKRVMNATGPETVAAYRWAKLFYMQDLPKSADPKLTKIPYATKIDMIEKEAKDWLTKYPSFVRGADGQGVLWELANAQYVKGQIAQGPAPKKTPATPPPLTKQAEANYLQAIKTLDRLATIDGDYSEKASQLGLAIQFMLMENTKRELASFDDWFLKARFEMYQLRKLSNADEKGGPEKTEAKRKTHLREITRAFQRALALTDSKTPLSKVDDTKFYLAGAYRTSGDLYRTAVAGEALGRVRPPTRRAGAGMSYAIDAYANLYEVDKDEGLKQRVQELCDFALAPESQKFWSSDPVTNLANYHLAMLYNKDKDFEKAATHLSRLTSDFGGFNYAMAQLVFICREGFEEAKDDKARLRFKTTSLKAMDRMSKLPVDADPSTAAAYFLSRLEGPRYLFTDADHLLSEEKNDLARAKYEEMGKLVDALAAEFAKTPIKISQTNQERIDFSLKVYKKYVTLGTGNVLYRQSKFEEAIKSTEPIVESVKKLDKGADTKEIKLRDVKVVGSIIGLTLRSQVQKGDMGEAKTLLTILKKLRGTEEGIGADTDTNRVVVDMLREVNSQLRLLESQKKAEELKSLKSNFGKFLDDIANDFIKTNLKGANVDFDGLIMLTRAYQSIGNPEKAAEILNMLPRPTALGKKVKDKLTDDEENSVRKFWESRLEYAKLLRESRKDLDTAMKAMNELLGHELARYQLQAEFERNLILEEQGHLAPAIKQWQKFLKNPGLPPIISQNPAVKKLYFEAMFNNTRVLYLFAKTTPALIKVPDQQEKFYSAAANQILSLEFANSRDGWNEVGELYRALLEAEPPLKKAYEKLKKDRGK